MSFVVTPMLGTGALRSQPRWMGQKEAERICRQGQAKVAPGAWGLRTPVFSHLWCSDWYGCSKDETCRSWEQLAVGAQMLLQTEI